MTRPGGRVLVTGATGFIGGRLCEALAADGLEVHGLARREAPLAGAGRLWRCDVADVVALRRVLAELRPALVYHLAAHVTGARELEAVAPTFHGRLLGTVNLLAAACETDGCRVVLAGSLEEPDEAEPVPVSPYAAATWASSGYARMFRRLYGLPVTIARIFMAYGPGRQNLATLVPHVITSFLRGEAPALSSGVRPVDWIYVDDVVRGLLAVGRDESGSEGDVELGSGELVTVRELVERIARELGTELAPRFGALPDRPFERVRRAALGETRARLGWAPEVGLDEGLRRTVAWFRDAFPTPGAR